MGASDVSNVNVVCCQPPQIWYWGGSGDDLGKAIKVDDDGIIYITGDTRSFGAGNYDILFLKMNGNSGNILLNKTWGGSNEERATDIVFDGDKNVYIAGSTISFGICTLGPKYDEILLKISNSGELLWNKVLIGASPGCNWGIIYKIILLNNNLYTVWQLNRGGFGYCCGGGTMKLDLDGNIIFQKKVVNSTDITHHWRDLTTDGEYLYAVGISPSVPSGSQKDALIMKYDINGNIIWEKAWIGTGIDFDSSFTDIFNRKDYPSVDTDGQYLYAVGFTNSYGVGGMDTLYLKYDLNGNLITEKTWGGTNNENGIVFSYGEYIYIVGATKSFSSGDYDGFLLKIRKSDDSLVLQKKWGCNGTDELFYNIYVKDDYVYIVGTTTSGCKGLDKWQNINGVYQNISGSTKTTLNDTPSDVNHTVQTPSGNVSSPTPTTNGNAGGKDIVIMKIHINDIDNL
jgi:hypothetical protein